MTLVQSVRSHIDPQCVVRSCKKQGCKVPLSKAPAEHVVLDLDKPGSPFSEQETRCDYLVFLEGDGEVGQAVALELKRGQAQVGIVDQLQAGADIAARLIPKDENVDFTPVAAHKGIHSKVRKILVKRAVKFRQQRFPVLLITCGTPLMKALGD